MKNTSTIKRSAMGLCVGLVLWLAALPAQAATVTYSLNYIFSPPTGSVSPLGTVTLTDVGNFVDFSVKNLAGVGTKLDSLYFNFAHGSLNPSQLAFSNVSATAGTYTTVLAPTTSAQVASLKADGDGYFDGKFAYKTNNFLGNGQTLSFRLSSTGQNLSISDFNLLSIPGGGSGSFITASHIQNMPYSGDSVWVGNAAAVPLPAAALLFGSGLLGLASARRGASGTRREGRTFLLVTS